MIDYFFIAYIIWRLVKGYINGVGKEIDSLCVTLLLLCGVMGIFVITELSGVIKSTLQILLTSTSFWISFSSFIIAVLAFFIVRGKVSRFAEKLLTGKSSKYGGILISLLRSTIVIYLFVLVLNWIPSGLFKNLLHESVIARPIVEFNAMNFK